MIVFVISHGQADVERGFSINTSVIDVNMKEQPIQSKCLVRDIMQKHNLQLATIEITNVLKLDNKWLQLDSNQQPLSL